MSAGLVGPLAAGAPPARELRGQVRHWRRGRANTTWLEVFQDAYVAVFSGLVLGAMAVNVVLNLRRAVSDVCVSDACVAGRAAIPWLTALVLLAAAVAVARVVGPVAVTPAVASWLLPAPVDRSSMLRPRLVVAVLVAAVVTGTGTGAVSLLAGVPVLVTLVLAGGTAGLAVAAVGLCTWAQARHEPVARATGLVLVAAAWGVLLLLALGPAPPLPRASYPPAWFAGLAVTTLAALVGAVVGWRALPAVPGRSLAAAGSLAPSLSGALAVLDLALVWDVLHARAWRARGTVRPLRGRCPGAWALLDRDLARLRRRPRGLLLPLAALVVPYAASTLHAGRLVVLVAALTGFVGCVGLFAGLRVLSRTPHLARTLPLSPAVLGWAAVAVPGLVVLAWSLLAAPALVDAMPADAEPWLPALFALVVALAATAACVRWMAGRPPDYAMPLVSSPAGAIPPSLAGSAARGLDLALLVTGPVLVVPSAGGAAVSCAVGVVALAVMLRRT